jgi:mevalonate pyrophosphate decarboxylase
LNNQLYAGVSKRKATSVIDSQLSPWALMEQALKELEETGYETHVEAVIKEIKQKHLHPLIEAAYEDSKSHLNDKKHDYPKNVINLYKAFVRAVEDVKEDTLGSTADTGPNQVIEKKEDNSHKESKKKKTG